MANTKHIPTLKIHQFGQKLADSDFYSNEFQAHSRRNGDMIFKPHSHDFYLCVLFTKGRGIHEIDFNTYDIAPGSLFFLKPGQTHHWKFDQVPQGYIFFHTQAFYELCFLNSNLLQYPFYATRENLPALYLKKEDIPHFEGLFRQIYLEYTIGGGYQYEKLNSLINLVYIDVTRRYSEQQSGNLQTSKTYLHILERFQELLELHFKEEKLPAFYASQLNITTKHLNRITKSAINKTCSAMIRERVMLEAKRLLVHSNRPLSIIGHQLGYGDYPYFSKIFKVHTGMTPYAFRKKY